MMKRERNGLLAVVVLGVALGAAPAGAAILFTDATVAAGLPSDFFGGTTLHNLGICWIDLNNDGWADLFAVNGFDNDAHVYLNDGDGTFTTRDDLLPNNLPNVEMSGCVYADYDNDGDSDVYVQVSNEQFDLNGDNNADGPMNWLLRNNFMENGGQIIDGRPLFQNIATFAGVANPAFPPLGDYPGYRSMTGGWLDFDRDGCVDLYVGNMVLQAPGEASNRDFLYHNRCDGTFEDVTAVSGVDNGTNPELWRPTLAFIAALLDGDLWPDLYAVNVHEAAPYHEDLLYRNRRNGRFEEITGRSPGMGDDAGSGMGIDVADVDLDGDWEIYITDVFNSTNDALPLGNAYYVNLGNGTWMDNTAPDAGIAADFSWGTNFFDIDQDGYEDLFVGTAADAPHPFVFQNSHDGTFADVSAAAGFTANFNIRGSATADYDGDGDLDLAIVEYNRAGALRLYRNDSTDQGHWLKIKLVATESNASAIGALVKVRAGTMRLMRQVKGGSSTHSQSDLVVHFGLGSATQASQVQVLWPSGLVTNVGIVAADQLITVTEGQ